MMVMECLSNGNLREHLLDLNERCVCIVCVCACVHVCVYVCTPTALRGPCNWEEEVGVSAANRATSRVAFCRLTP